VGILIRWEGGSDVGLVRRRNEDAWGAVSLDGSSGGVFLAVADGMGGQPGGDVAARAAVETALDAARRRGGEEDPVGFLRGLFVEAQAALSREAQARPALARMGTTLTVLLLRDDGAWVGHVGDSRLAWQRGNGICLVTDDHSLAWDLVEAGLLSPDEAEQDPSGAILTRHLGPLGEVHPDIFERSLLLAGGDRLLLLSDGLGKVVQMDEVARIVEGAPLADAIQNMIGQARSEGAPDNVTIVLVEVTDPPRPTGEVLTWEESRYRWSARDPES
jgi:PPM family protein phosphatase